MFEYENDDFGSVTQQLNRIEIQNRVSGQAENEERSLKRAALEDNGDFEVLLITGMSGAGRSQAADSVEDIGWYVVDNLPPAMLIPLVDLMTAAGSSTHKLAAVIDVRSRNYFSDLNKVFWR